MRDYVQTLEKKLWKLHDDTKRVFSFYLPFSNTKSSDFNIKEKAPSSNKKPDGKQYLNNVQITGLWLGPLLFIFILLFVSPEGLSKEAISILASTLWIATWWITEAVPIAITALLPVILFPLTGGLTSGVTNAYGDSTIFLFLGGFVLAIALEKWNLHRRITLKYYFASRNRYKKACVRFYDCNRISLYVDF